MCSKQYCRSSMLNVDMKKINTKKTNWNAKISKWHRRVDSLSANGVHRSVSTPVLNLKILQLCQFPFSSTYGLPLQERAGGLFPIWWTTCLLFFNSTFYLQKSTEYSHYWLAVSSRAIGNCTSTLHKNGIFMHFLCIFKAIICGRSSLACFQRHWTLCWRDSNGF